MKRAYGNFGRTLADPDFHPAWRRDIGDIDAIADKLGLDVVETLQRLASDPYEVCDRLVDLGQLTIGNEPTERFEYLAGIADKLLADIEAEKDHHS